MEDRSNTKAGIQGIHDVQKNRFSREGPMKKAQRLKLNKAGADSMRQPEDHGADEDLPQGERSLTPFLELLQKCRRFVERRYKLSVSRASSSISTGPRAPKF
ncbi:hypothetical protein JTE90_002882 [Oedothorax gibbosus]|uniref:Uncharacterized protein n=1 Tax=Oedothorax gibbosus TaxID=931172 RepID=A0AAV6VAJ2_9ARAC|nr:hypothetical protein JTE90_002882 [Oedothorax gibbosus]